MLETLNERLQKRYANLTKDLNKHVMVLPEIDGELPNTKAYMVPTVTLVGDGTSTTNAPSLPAQASVRSAKQQAITVMQRVLIPTSELEIALNNESYFNYLMDEVVNKALNQYAVKFGPYDLLRFGEYYAKFDPLTVANTEAGEFMELRIHGKFAGK